MTTSKYPSYLDLLVEHSGRLSYEQKLSCLEWQDKRKVIIERDGGRCTSCGKSHYLQVHHTFYVLNCLPWEYTNDDLITLCNDCHFKLHVKHTIPVYETRGGRLVKVTKCTRCKGVGKLSRYKHIQAGICFRCRGERYEELIDKNLLSQIPEKTQDNYVQERQDNIYDNNEIPKKNLLIRLQEEYKKSLEEWLNS